MKICIFLSSFSLDTYESFLSENQQEKKKIFIA